MTDTPHPPDSHAWVHERLAAYLADGLSAEERQRFDAHVNACAECFDAFTEARDADRALLRALAPLVPDADLEQRTLTHFRENTMKRFVHPLLRRAGYAAAACVALAATGVFANHIMHADGQFNNPFTERLVAKADTAAPGLNGKIADLESKVVAFRGTMSDLRGVGQSASAYAGADGSWLHDATTAGKKMFYSPAGTDIAAATQPAFARARSATVPVIKGSDPNSIPLNDDIRTQIIPLDHIDAAQLTSELRPMISADADISSSAGSNAIVITDTSAKIHRLAEIVHSLDTGKASDNIIQYRQFASGNAGDAARLINDMFAPPPASTPAGAAGRGGRGGGGFGGGGDSGVHAEVDAKTNTLVLSGKADEVEKAMERVNEIDRAGAVAAAQKQYEGIIDRTGKAVLRQNIDSAEHLTPTYTVRDQLTERDELTHEGQLAAGQQPGSQGIGGGAMAYKGTTTVPPSLNLSNIPSGGSGGNFGGGGGFANGSSGGFFQNDANQSKVAESGLNTYGPPDSGYAYNRRHGAADDWSYSTGGGNSPLTVAGVGAVTGTHVLTNQVDLALTKDGNGTLTLNGSGGDAGGTRANGGAVAMSGGTLKYGDSLDHQYGFDSPAYKAPTAGSSLTAMTEDEKNGLKLTPQAAAPGAETGDQRSAQGPADHYRLQSNAGPESTLDAAVQKNEQSGKQLASAANKAYDSFQTATPGTTGVPGSIPKLGPVAGTNFDIVSNGSDKTSGTDRTLLAAATPNKPATSAAPAATAPAAAQPPKNLAPEIAAGLKIIKNGTVEFEVRSFDDTYTLIKARAEEAGGFVASTNSDKLANGKVRGTIVVRVPPQSLDQFLSRIRGLGDLKSQQISATDVTKDYYDIDSELRGLTTMESRLLDLIKNGKGEVKDLIEAEKQLGDTRIKIEKLKGQISYYDNLVALCTISITAYEKDIQTPTAAYEQEIVGVNVETEQVEAEYQAARKIFEDAKGHILESQLKNADAEHVAAHIVADVPPDQADFVAGQLKQLGKVASFNRDRKQTTTGGSGAPDPSIQVEHKDTQFTIDLFNLANMSPRETTVLRVAVPDVEKAYEDVLARVRKDAAAAAAPAAGVAPAPNNPPAPAVAAPESVRAVGRVVASSLNGEQPEQMSADVRAEVRAESADTILNAIRNSGEILGSNLVNNPDNANTTSAKEGIQLTLVNIASVPPKEVNSVTIAVRNVEDAYNELLGSIRKAAPAGQNASPLMPPSVGRVLNSGLTGQQPEQMAGDIRAEIRSDMADDILRLAKSEGELLNSSTTDAPENAIATAIKRGLQVHFVNVAGVAPREAQQIRGVALDVPSAYQKLLSALQTLAGNGGNAGNAAAGAPGGSVHIFSSSLQGTDRRRMVASFTFDAPRSADADISRAFNDAGIDFLSRTIVRSSDTANTLDSKVRYQVDEIRSAETLDPRRTFMLTEEVPDVDKAVTDLKSMFPGLDFNISHPPGGDANAHAVADLSVEDSRALRTAIASLHAVEKDNQVINNNNVPETKFGRERVDISLRNEPTIIKKDQGVNSALRAAMSTISAALFEAVYLIVVGLVFALPFLLVLWLVMRIIKRRRRAMPAT